MMASVLEKRLSDGSKAYLVRFRTADGKARSKQFKRKREADAYVSFVEVDRMNGTLVDPRLHRYPRPLTRRLLPRRLHPRRPALQGLPE